MKKIISLLLIFNLAHATAPTGYKNETATTKTYAQDLVFPNNQLTKQAGLDSRIETGNTNLLTNPSFEHSTPTTGWTITNATATADTTNQVEGKKALSLALTGALSVVQDSTINAANLVGLQGVARIKIKTSDVDGLKVCARNAGVTSTSLCINIPKDGVWKEINIPYILTATSNGIAITSTGTTGTVKLDDAFVGTSAPLQNVNGAKLVGTVTITGCASSWSTTSSTLVAFGTQSGCIYATYGQALAPSTNIPAIKFASLPAGDYRLEYEGALAMSSLSTITATYQFTDGTNTSREQSAIQVGSNNNGGSSGISQSISYSTAQSNVTFEIKGKTSSGTSYISGTTAQPGTIKVWYFPPESKIYSQASQDYDWTAYTPTLTGFGTVSGLSAYHKRKGSDLYLRLNFTCGAVTATEAQVSLPNSITTSSTIPTLGIFGHGNRASSAASQQDILAQPSVAYLNFGNQGNINGLTKANGNNLCLSGETLSFLAGPIPIQGWQDYGVIVGRFTDTVNDTGSVKPISKKAALTCTSSSAIISQGLGSSWITSIGNIASGACAVAITSGIFNSTPLCQITPRGNLATTTTWKITESSNTSISLYCTSGGSNCTGGENVNIVCEGLGI